MPLTPRLEIHSLIAMGGRPNPKLKRVGTDALLKYVLNTEEAAWRRATIVRFWERDVPAKCVAPLWSLLRNSDESPIVRLAALDTLYREFAGEQRAQLLSWLRQARPSNQTLTDRFLEVRVELSDRTAIPKLIKLANNPWRHRRELGLEGLSRIRERLGDGAILEELGFATYDEAAGSPLVEVRVLAIRALAASNRDLSPYLLDPVRRVARQVYDMTKERGFDRGALRALAFAPDTPDEGRAWVLLALHRLGEAVELIESGLGQLDEPRVPVEGVPDDMRRAVVCAYAPGESETDPRWILERAMGPACERSRGDAHEATEATRDQLVRLVHVLSEERLEPEAPISAGDFHQMGRGTFFVIPVLGTRVHLSTLGPFVGSDDELPERAVDAVAAAGFRWIEPPLSNTFFDALCVYHFGERGPLPIHELLFYWQD